MARASATLRSYRCYYTPVDRFGSPVATDTGVLPYTQIKAEDAESAQRAAHRKTGCPVSSVERLEHAA